MNTAGSYELLRLRLERIQAQGGDPQEAAECARRFLELERKEHVPVHHLKAVPVPRLKTAAARSPWF
jgi:hypothetical protein